MSYRIEQRHGLHLVIGEDGNVAGTYRTRSEAVERIQELGREEAEHREQVARERSTDPEVTGRRAVRRIYAFGERPENRKSIAALRRVLPRKGQARTATARAQSHMDKWLDGHIAIAASEPELHTALNRTATERQTAGAAEAKRAQRAAMRRRALALAAQGKTSTQIAAALGCGARYVRKLLKK